MPGWGLGGWGLGSWGFGLGPFSLFIANAYASSTRSIHVTLSQPADLASALSPTSWTIQRLDTGEFLTVITVVAGALNQEFDVYTIERFPAYPNQLQIRGDGLLSASLSPIVPPKFAVVYGLANSVSVNSVKVVDLENPQYELPDRVAGTLRVDSSGDYVDHSGVPFLRKLVIRRLMTTPGDFFHLPDYGIGIRLKEPLPMNDLVKLRTEIQRQVLLEPEFDSAQVSVSLATNGVLTITVKAVLSTTQQEVVIPIEVPQSLVSL